MAEVVSQPINVLGIAGSLRRKSYNQALLRSAAELAPEDMNVHVFDLSPIPLYDADLEAQGMPQAVISLHDHIAGADALLIATPEYNYSISGVLKNALDWASRRTVDGQQSPLTGKPAAVIGAGGRYGTVRAQAHLRYILLHNDLKLLNKPEIMVARASKYFDEAGRLADEDLRNRIAHLMIELRDWTLLLRGRLQPA